MRPTALPAISVWRWATFRSDVERDRRRSRAGSEGRQGAQLRSDVLDLGFLAIKAEDRALRVRGFDRRAADRSEASQRRQRVDHSGPISATALETRGLCRLGLGRDGECHGDGCLRRGEAMAKLPKDEDGHCLRCELRTYSPLNKGSPNCHEDDGHSTNLRYATGLRSTRIVLFALPAFCPRFPANACGACAGRGARNPS